MLLDVMQFIGLIMETQIHKITSLLLIRSCTYIFIGFRKSL